MEEDLRKRYKSIIKAIDNSEAEIESMVRQKQMDTIEFSEIIKAQAKLNNSEKLIRNILNNIEKYHILEIDIVKEIEICQQKSYQKKQHELNKKYMKKE